MFEVLVGGLVQGAYFALMGMGLVLVYRQSGILNFAHGAFATVASYIAFAGLEQGLPYWVAAVVAIAATALVAMLVDLAIVRRLLRASELAAGIGTIGVALVLIGIVSWLFGTTQRALPPPIPGNGAIVIGTIRVGVNAIAAVAVTLLIALATYLVLEKTRVGLMIRAAAEGPVTSSLMGINVARLRSSVWAIAGVLAAIAGLFITPANFLGPSFSTDFMVIAFVALVLGGLESMGGVLVSAFIFGLIDSLFSYWIVGALTEVLAFFCVCCVLLVLPHGLFGRQLLRVVEPLLRARKSGSRLRVPKLELRLPLGPPAVRKGIGLMVAILVLAALPSFLPQTELYVIATALAFFLAVMSQNLLSGYVGILSLGQAAFMGIGAYILAIVMDQFKIPFLGALLLAILGTAFLAAVFSFAAARLSGVYLVLLTFSLSLAFPVATAFPKELTGGAIGMPMPTFSILGFSVASVIQLYYAIAAIVLLVGVPFWFVLNGRAGRVCRAVRDNELGAAASGVNVFAIKVIAFAVSGALAALSGVLMGCLVGYLVPESYSAWQSVFLLVAALIGGPTVLGSFIGGLFLEGVLFFSSNLPNLPYIGLGAVVLAAQILAPEGLANLFRTRNGRAQVRPLDGPARSAMPAAAAAKHE